MGFLMHFRPFSVKKIQFFSDFASFFRFFHLFYFFYDLLNIGLLLPPLNLKTPDSPRGAPLSYSIKNKEVAI